MKKFWKDPEIESLNIVETAANDMTGTVQDGGAIYDKDGKYYGPAYS